MAGQGRTKAQCRASCRGGSYATCSIGQWSPAAHLSLSAIPTQVEWNIKFTSQPEAHVPEE